MSDFALLCALLGVLLDGSLRRLEDVMKRLIGLLCVLVFVVCAMVAWAEPPSGVVGKLIGRGTYEPFKFKTDPGPRLSISRPGPSRT